jgi:hypothetical protein
LGTLSYTHCRRDPNLTKAFRRKRIDFYPADAIGVRRS